MIEIKRSLARQLRAVFRRCFRKPYGPRPPVIQVQAGAEGLQVRVPHLEVAVAFHQPGALPASGVVCLPLEALADFEGKSQVLVSLEPAGEHKTVARWQDAGVPQVMEYAVQARDRLPDFPTLPARLTRCPPGLLKALDEAVKTACKEEYRQALTRLLLRGKSGEVVATDGRQLLIQGGFAFPWDEDLLIPRLSVFGCRELGDDPRIEVGRTEHTVVLRVGAWTFSLLIDKAGRYPKYEEVFPKPGEVTDRCRIGPEDAAFLERTLPRLPGQDDENRPVTVDFNGQVCLRARGADQTRATEVVLARSAYSGKAVQLCVNRDYLSRALRLGFSEVEITSPDNPLVFRGEKRVFVVMPLSKEGVIAPSEDALRIASAEEDHAHKPPSERRKPAMPSHTANPTNGNGHADRPRQAEPEQPAKGEGGYADLLAEALALKQLLHDAYSRSSRLVAALKRQRKQTRLVATTLASLRQLQQIGG